MWSCRRRCGRSEPIRSPGATWRSTPRNSTRAPKLRATPSSRSSTAGTVAPRAVAPPRAIDACSASDARLGGWDASRAQHRGATHGSRRTGARGATRSRRPSKTGLGAKPFSLPCRFFYDAEGSRLFEAICELPEYYLTRAEHEILTRHADEIAARCPTPLFLAELGSGSATKTRLLIEAFLRHQGSLRYVPVDISQSMLDESAQSLLADYHGLEITAIASEYGDGLRHLGKDTRLPKLIAWLGSNIGNFARADAHHFVAGIRDAMSADDRLLLGVDLRKDERALELAYDDAQGVTARFNKNLLARINRELGGSFDLADWTHRARVVDDGGRVEIGLVCRRSCDVPIAALGQELPLRARRLHPHRGFDQVLASARSRSSPPRRRCGSTRAGSIASSASASRCSRRAERIRPRAHERERPGAWNPGPPWEGDI